jgi:dephospho-CoA kinase
VTELRDRTAAGLSRFLSREKLDNPWSDRAGSSTRVLYAIDDLYDPDRLDLHDELIANRERLSAHAAADGELAVVVTSGPPGAGKSTALQRFPEFAAFRDIDADDFKDPLLSRARDDGLLTGWLMRELPDGRPVALRELSTFVHAESTVVAAAYRDQAFARGENIIVHGTLADDRVIDELLSAIDDAGYERIVIIDVSTPQAVATERALARWWAGRTSSDPLGGRFVPPSAIERYFPDGPERAVTRGHALALAQRAEELEWSVRMEEI